MRPLKWLVLAPNVHHVVVGVCRVIGAIMGCRETPRQEQVEAVLTIIRLR